MNRDVTPRYIVSVIVFRQPDEASYEARILEAVKPFGGVFSLATSKHRGADEDVQALGWSPSELPLEELRDEIERSVATTFPDAERLVAVAPLGSS
jgi:hypothetical protein